MRAEELSTELAEQLSKAQARIAELETANALLRAEHQLHADMCRQALVLEQVHDAIITTDLAGTITNWNRGAEKMFGYEAHEVVGHNVALLYFEEDREQVRAHLLQPLMREREREIELRQRRKSGEESYIRLSLTVLRDETDEAYAILGVATDITAQRKAELALRESEKRYRQVTDALPQIAYITRLDGKTEMINGHWERYSGSRMEESLDFDWLSWVHPEDAPGITARRMESIRTGEPFEMEYRVRNAAGEYRWHLSKAVAVRNAQGATVYWVGTLTDIHDRRSAESALRENEERFQLAFQAIEGIVYDWDPLTGRVQRTGDMERLIGIALEEADPTDRWWQDRVHPDDWTSTSLATLPLLGPGRSNFEREFRVRHADGHWVHMCDRGFVTRDNDGIPIRVVGSTYDITERKRLERELKESNKRLKFQADILATTNDAVIALDANRLISYSNAAAERMYGFRSEEALGQPLSAIYGQSWPEAEDEQRALSELAVHGSWKGESVHWRKDGTQFIVSSTVSSLPPELGGGMVAVIRDISERKRAEDRIQRHAAQLAKANEDLLHFAYAVSHDLQAPLRTITSFSQLLGLKYKTSFDAQGSEFLRWVIESGTRMSAMIRDLLRFATVAGHEIEFDKAVPLDQTVSMALENLRGEIEETGASISYNSLPAVPGDAVQLAQLFQNLIGNSIKYRKPDTAPEIRISAEQSGNEWVITVRDNGIGFDPNEAERLFGVFQRLHEADYAGTGIGLAICKRIVERFGGRIWATATPGEGAMFSFSISRDVIGPGLKSEMGKTGAVKRTAPVDGDSKELSVSSTPFDELFHALDLSPAIVRGLDGTIMIWTKGAEHLYGWSKAEAIGQRAHELMRTEFPKLTSEIDSELLRTGEWSGELKTQKRDGSTFWVASHWALYRDGSGRPQSVIQFSNDITALKEADAALRRSTEQRDLALSAGQMGTWRWDKDSVVVEWDTTAERLLGMAPGSFERTFEAFRDRIHPEDLAAHAERTREAFENGPEYTVENRIRHEDGGYRWWRGQGRVTVDGFGEPTGLMGVVWDITNRKQEEMDREFLLGLSEKLLQSTDRGRLAALAMSEVANHLGVSRCCCDEVDPTGARSEILGEYRLGGLSMLRSQAHDVFGDVGAELAINLVVEVGDATRDPRVAKQYTATYHPFGIRAFLAVPLFQQGTWRATTVVADAVPRSWQKREIAVLSAVSERLWFAVENARLLEESRQREERFEATFEQAAVGMAHVGLDGRWLRVNDCICTTTGYSREELLASRFQDITHPDDLDLDLRQFDALQRREIDSYSVEKRYVRKDGSTIWINLTVALAMDHSGIPQYAISVVEDIAVRKGNRQELEASNALAESRLREIALIYSSAPVGLASLDRDLRVLRINDRMAEIIGTPAAEAIGHTLAEVVPEIGPQLEPIYRSVVDLGVPVCDLEVRGTTRANPGVERTWLASYFPLHGPEGGIHGINAVVLDITDRERAERAMLEAAERLKIAAAAAQLGVFTWNPSSDEASWENDRMYEITGRRREDGPANATEFKEKVLLPEEAGSFDKAFRDGMEGGRPFRHAFRIRRGDGTLRWIEVCGQREMEPGGALRRVTGVMADITEQMESAQELRDQKKHLRNVLDSLFVCVGVMSVDGILLEANRAPRGSAGVWPDDELGKYLPHTYAWSWSTEEQERLWKTIRKAQAGESSRYDTRVLMKDGYLMPVDFMLSPLRDDAGQIEYLIPSAVPIEERKEMEDALRKSEKQFRELAEALPALMWIADSQGDTSYHSGRWAEYTGISNDRALGVDWVSVVHPDDKKALYARWQESVATGRPYEFEARLRRHDGAYRWFLNRAVPVRDEEQNVEKWFGTSADIHERKLTEEALRRSNEDLEQFATAASHDLREPLRTVSIYSQLLIRKYDGVGEDAARFAQFVVSGVKRMDGLLNGILAYSRAGEPEREPAIGDSEAILAEALRTMEPALAASGAIITYDHLPSVAIPGNQLLQLFQHVLGNAIEYRGEHAPRIHVSASREGAWQKFGVSDNGVGIQAEYLEEIFSVFKRLHNDERPGVGMGLAICKRIVERHGGVIWAESEIGKGTTFFFTSPSMADGVDGVR